MVATDDHADRKSRSDGDGRLNVEEADVGEIHCVGGALESRRIRGADDHRQCECGIGGVTLSQWPSEAKFVAIRIGQVKEPLAPFGIARGPVWSVASRDHARMEAVDGGIVEDDTSPPKISLRRL